MRRKFYVDVTLLQSVFVAVTKTDGITINYFLVPLRVVFFVLMLVPIIAISVNVKEVEK